MAHDERETDELNVLPNRNDPTMILISELRRTVNELKQTVKDLPGQLKDELKEVNGKLDVIAGKLTSHDVAIGGLDALKEKMASDKASVDKEIGELKTEQKRLSEKVQAMEVTSGQVTVKIGLVGFFGGAVAIPLVGGLISLVLWAITHVPKP